MHTKEDPKNLVQLGPCFDLVQTVVLLLSTKASLHSCCPLLAQFHGDYLSVILMFASPAFSLEVGSDLLTGTVLPVSIGSIYIIYRDVGDLSKERAAVPD
ncbi:hypothetical protein ES705_48805 [subsurface metagenome]